MVDFPQLQWRPASVPDVPAWAALIARTAAVETPVWYEREADLQQLLDSRKNPPASNTLLGVDGLGIPRVYARIARNPGADKAHGFGCVDPEWQRRGVGTALLGWLEDRTRQRFAEDGAAPGAQEVARLRILTEEQHAHQARRLASSGYSVVRYFNEMHRSLDQPMPSNVLEYRGRGIAKALLADAIRRFAASGMDVASLDVDSANPTGALALYTRMGYRAVNRSMAWDKEL